MGEFIYSYIKENSFIKKKNAGSLKRVKMNHKMKWVYVFMPQIEASDPVRRISKFHSQ